MENAKYYESLAEKRLHNYDEIEKALEVVRKFIIRKKRILYGGMAIDLSLRLKGDKIYDDDVLPDYDFMSPNHIQDSYELADILYQQGFKNVSSISAIHVTSRRVRVQFVVVADITYIPPSVFEKLPYLQYPLTSVHDSSVIRNIRVIHPHFQRMDMHRAFCTPLEKPPREVILHRLKKDVARFKLFMKYYPIDELANTDQPFRMQEITINPKILENNVLGGFTAYGVLYEIFKTMIYDDPKDVDLELTTTNGNILKKLVKIMRAEKVQKIIDSTDIQTRLKKVIPLECPLTFKGTMAKVNKVTIITDNYKKVLAQFDKSAKKEYYDKFLDDYRPRTIIVHSGKNEQYEIFDNKGRLLPIFELKILGLNSQIRICSYQYVLLYLLQKYYETSNSQFINYYLSLENMVIIMEIIFKKICELSDNSSKFDDFIRILPFFLNLRMYGCCNWSPDYIKFIVEKTELFEGIPPEGRQIFREPFGYYPDQKQRPPTFDVRESEFFDISGQKRKQPFKELSLI